jgi:hypothetical protein
VKLVKLESGQKQKTFHCEGDADDEVVVAGWLPKYYNDLYVTIAVLYVPSVKLTRVIETNEWSAAVTIR